MAGDGVSMPTQLAQLGSVAKTQANSQQASHPATSFSDQLSKKDDLKAQRVKEIKKSEKSRVDPDEDRRRKRKRKRLKKKHQQNMSDGSNADSEDLLKDDEECEEEIGLLVDLRA